MLQALMSGISSTTTAATACKSVLGAVTPSSTALPGGSVLMNLLNGVMFFGLAISALGLIISGAFMAVGHYTNNGNMNSRGRTGVLGAFVGVVVCAGAVAIVNFAFTTGSTIHC